MEDDQLKAALGDDPGPGASDATETGFDAGRDERDLGSELDAGYGYGDEDAVVSDPEAGPLDRGAGASYGGQGGIVQADEG